MKVTVDGIQERRHELETALTAMRTARRVPLPTVAGPAFLCAPRVVPSRPGVPFSGKEPTDGTDSRANGRDGQAGRSSTPPVFQAHVGRTGRKSHEEPPGRPCRPCGRKSGPNALPLGKNVPESDAGPVNGGGDQGQLPALHGLGGFAGRNPPLHGPCLPLVSVSAVPLTPFAFQDTQDTYAGMLDAEAAT